MLLLIYFILFIYLLYFIWIIEPLFKKRNDIVHHYQPFVSIIISAKNETHNINNLLENLRKQNYPINNYEIIIANDKSTDSTLEKLTKIKNSMINLIIINITKTPINWSSKKWALNECIQKAKGEIILQTDADCRHTYTWISEMIKPFKNQNTGFVCGPSYIGTNKNFWDQILKLESISQESFTYANSKRELYISCTARNIGFRKLAFKEVKGYDDIAHIKSGDDDLLLHKVVTQTNWGIEYIANKKALVESDSPKSIKSFYLQRLRYASKGLLYYTLKTPLEVKVILPFLFVANIACALSIINFINTQSWIWVPAILLKSISDIILINKYMYEIKMDFKLLYFMILTIIHPFYVIIIGGIAPFTKVQWK